jgi:very-short-patch-repair endonuclease
MSMKTITTKYFHNAQKLRKAKTKKNLILNQDHMQHNNLRQDNEKFKKSTQMGLY